MEKGDKLYQSKLLFVLYRHSPETKVSEKATATQETSKPASCVFSALIGYGDEASSKIYSIFQVATARKQSIALTPGFIVDCFGRINTSAVLKRHILCC